jgi:hypothetical protein
MTIKEYLRFSWVPMVLSITVTVTEYPIWITFDPMLFLACLPIFLAHFYLTHFLGAKYFAIHNPSKIVYWKIISISYLPLIISFWIQFALNVPSEHGINLGAYDILIIGLIVTFLLFAILIIKKVKMDLDAVLALTFIIGLVGAATLVFFIWLTLKITNFQ